MLLFQYIVFSTFIAAFAIFWHAVYWYFDNEKEEKHWRLQALKSMLAVFFFFHGTILLLAENESKLAWSAGFLAYVATVAIFRWATNSARNAHLGLAFNTVTSVSVAKTGPYKWVRHPIYANYLIYWSIAPIIHGEWWTWIPTAVAVATYFYAARGEEAALLSGPLAKEYAEYQQSTGMFFPKLLRRPAHADRDNARKAA